MKRALHFIPAFSIGGVESLIMSLYRNTDRTKVQFDFLIEVDDDLEVFNEIKEMGGNVYCLPKLEKNHLLRYIKQIESFFSKNASKFDIVHCHHIERATVVLYYARKYGIDFRIIHAHTDSIEDLKFKHIRKIFMRMNNHLSTHLFACSQAAGEFQFGKSKKAFIVLKNAIDSKKFSYNEEKRKVMRQLMKLKNRFVVGHTGRFTYPKNHWKIIDVFNELHTQNPNAHLLLVGDGPLKEEIEQKVRALGIEDVVTFTGARDDIADLLQAMDIFILPSFYEGFCISLLEAQSVGLPCVTSDIIPKEVEVTSLIKKISLSKSDKEWADELLTQKNSYREDSSHLIVKAGYDIEENARWLERFYLRNKEVVQQCI